MGINNMLDYADSKRYIVARTHNGELYFWEAWDEKAEAKKAANEICGVVVENPEA
ncbi:MAG: hypothetical protein K2J32_15210 [Ruminococcus sp.]|nr:hypothetical protein [Ruminococcus sp.]